MDLLWNQVTWVLVECLSLTTANYDVFRKMAKYLNSHATLLGTPCYWLGCYFAFRTALIQFIYPHINSRQMAQPK